MGGRASTTQRCVGQPGEIKASRRVFYDKGDSIFGESGSGSLFSKRNGTAKFLVLMIHAAYHIRDDLEKH